MSRNDGPKGEFFFFLLKFVFFRSGWQSALALRHWESAVTSLHLAQVPAAAERRASSDRPGSLESSRLLAPSSGGTAGRTRRFIRRHWAVASEKFSGNLHISASLKSAAGLTYRARHFIFPERLMPIGYGAGRVLWRQARLIPGTRPRTIRTCPTWTGATVKLSAT